MVDNEEDAASESLPNREIRVLVLAGKPAAGGWRRTSSYGQSGCPLRESSKMVQFMKCSSSGAPTMRPSFWRALLLISATGALVHAAERKLDFNRDVRPILSENCFHCHGFDENTRQADLRLDVVESALADRDGVPAIVPGEPESSELWRRINSDDEAELMPPPDSHRVLKPEQKEILRRWIEQGAPYAEHWSFVPPVKAPLPEVSDKTWPRNEIDYFVLSRLDAEHLKPSPEADGRTLARRVSLDLSGLPPSAEEVEALLADENADAYERFVDHLLASPHFGERMALDWLDAARYADTNGYSIDGGRHMWLWRDWVIDAFNRNMPYDQFLREQLAGDLLPDRTEAQLIATGFQRNNMNTHEGGTIPEENLTNYNVDRVKTLGEAVLGLTLGCCQCHNHKYDPMTQEEYYARNATTTNSTPSPSATFTSSSPTSTRSATWASTAMAASIRALCTRLGPC